MGPPPPFAHLMAQETGRTGLKNRAKYPKSHEWKLNESDNGGLSIVSNTWRGVVKGPKSLMKSIGYLGGLDFDERKLNDSSFENFYFFCE
jgi:hypothetical protein